MTDQDKKKARSIIAVMRGIAMQSTDSALNMSIQAQLNQLDRLLK